MRKITQKKLGEILKVSPHTVMRWEKDKSSPSGYEIVALSQALNVTTSYLLGESDDFSKPATEAAEDLDQIMRDLAAENPDIVIRFRNMRQRWPELTKAEKRVILDGMLFVLGKADVELDKRLRKQGKRGNV